MKTSICIPVFNKLAFTKACLTDLFRLPNVEIIVVDNGSTDNTQAELSKLTNPNLHYIRREENGGFGVACNLGYKHATNENVIFLNNDIRVKNDSWLNTLDNAIEDDYIVGVSGGFVDPKQDYKFIYETNDPNKKFNYISGWCIAANKSTWNKLNIPRKDSNDPQIFDERFFLYYEETDACLRATEIGLKFRLVDIPVVHFGKVSSNQINVSKWYNTSRQIFLSKWSKGK
jgi:GT2 family glycosyltransferase